MGKGDLNLVERIASADSYLAVCVTTGASGSPQVSVVNAGIVDHPVGGEKCVALVARGDAVKLAHLRRRPEATLVFRAGWEWVAVSGRTELCGPDDPLDALDSDGVRKALRDVFHAAGGRHDDLDEYDRVMASDRRAAVFVQPARVYSNG